MYVGGTDGSEMATYPFPLHPMARTQIAGPCNADRDRFDSGAHGVTSAAVEDPLMTRSRAEGPWYLMSPQ